MSDPIASIQSDHQSARSLNDSNADICFLALTDNHRPTVRTLVLREISHDGFTLFINRTSAKWQVIQQNAEAELLLWYPTIQRQYRVHGPITELPRESIEQNWPRRPAGSKYLDHAYGKFANQSTEIESRQKLVDHIETFKAANPEETLTTPEFATGIRLQPKTIEMLDLNAHDRIHDRRKYTHENNTWQESQLMP